MDTFMNFMDKIYSDTKALTIVYVVGAALLLLFIIMLIFSLRKPKAKKINTKILDDPNVEKEKELISEDTVVEESKNEVVDSHVIVTDIESEQSVEEEVKEENVVSKAIENIENKDIFNNVIEDKKETINNLSSEIPDVDEFVDNVVKKTYEKNEQFSSVFVGENTRTIKLEKILDELNVDDEIKTEILPENEKELKIEEANNEETTNEEPFIVENEVEENEAQEVNEAVKIENVNNLDELKKAMEVKKNEVSLKQDELKAKLAGLKQPEKKDDVLKAEDLLNKLNSLKK